MENFVKSLKGKYKDKVLFTEKQGLNLNGDKLINLQLVDADKKKGFDGDLPLCSTKDGSTKRTHIVCKDLFNGGKRVKMVLVEGNAGMGKTTLCKMITEGWAEEKMLTQFECLVFLPLREKNVASAESVSDLFKLLHSSERIRTPVVCELEDSEGKGLLIVADGWDELGEAKRDESSFLYKLLFGVVLSSASVLLTSRPSASGGLHSVDHIDRFVEVVGFNEDEIKQYIECEFEKCPEKASGLIEQLANNPLIQSVCAVPLNCAITCNLWYTLDQQLPTTLTELYTLIILNVILRNISKLPDYKSRLSLKDFDSIPHKLEPYWWLTCKFAFETLSRDQLVFTENEVASLFPEGFESSLQFFYFGLLQSAYSLLPVGHGLSFHFLHLTFQEYLAALHLVTLPFEEQIKLVKEYGSTSRFEMVWRFFFGLGSSKEILKSRYVSRKVVCLDENVLQLIVSITSVDLLFCHCALESCNEVVSCAIAQYLDGNFESCDNLHDYVAILHVLSHTSHCESLDLKLWGCELTDELLDRLTNILSIADGKLNVNKLDLDQNELLTGRGISDLFNKASVAFSSFDDLSLSDNSLRGDCIDSIVSSLIHISCKSLSELTLSKNPLGVSGIQALERAAVAGILVNLEDLDISNTLTSDSDINSALLTTLLASVSSHFPHLTSLNVSDNNLGLPGAYVLGRALPLLTVGKRTFSLSLRDTMFDGEAISALTDCLDSCSKVTANRSFINQTRSRSQSESLSIATCNLRLAYNPIKFSGALALLRLLSSETCMITDLDLQNTDITNVSDSDSLMDMFVPTTSNYSLTELDFDHNNLSGEGLHLLSEFMNVSQSLERLSCTHCNLTSEDIQVILALLKSTHTSSSCCKLRYWFLWRNNIDDVGITALIENIPALFPSLEDVDVDYNPVSDDKIKRLEECLEVNKKRRESEEDNARVEAYLQKEAEIDTRRVTALSEWVTTQYLPQDQQLLDEFMRMWDELLEEMLLEFCVLNELFTDGDEHSSTTDEELSYCLQQTVPELFTSSLPTSSHPITPHDQLSTRESSSVCPVVESPVRLTPQGPERSETGGPSLDIDLETVDNSTKLDPDDVAAITGQLSGLAPMYSTLGYALGFDYNVMQTISYDFRNDRCLNALTQVIVEWLKQNYNHQKFGKPSWKNLVKALCHPTMRDEQGLAIQRAKKIAKRYPRH